MREPETSSVTQTPGTTRHIEMHLTKTHDSNSRAGDPCWGGSPLTLTTPDDGISVTMYENPLRMNLTTGDTLTEDVKELTVDGHA